MGPSVDRSLHMLCTKFLKGLFPIRDLLSSSLPLNALSLSPLHSVIVYCIIMHKKNKSIRYIILMTIGIPCLIRNVYSVIF